MTAAGPPPPTPGVWVDERLVVADSAIAGEGLFFAEAVPAGVVVIRLGGRLVSSAELDRLIALQVADPDHVPYVDTFTVDEDAHLVLPSHTIAHFGNHSCDPTLWHVGPYELATCRDVEAGEEATIDYGTMSGAEGFTMACTCGASECRGTVTSDDWRIADLQERYRRHFVPALEKRIAASRQP